MASVDAFKGFVKQNPELIRHVKTGNMTWQKFYEIYDLYGEEESAWKDFIKKEESKTPLPSVSEKTVFGVGDMLAWLKAVDLDSIQSGVQSLQRVVGLLQDFGTKEETPKKEEYKPRPLYKHFED